MTVCANGTKQSKTRQALGHMAGQAAGNSFVGEMLIDHDYRLTELEKRLQARFGTGSDFPRVYSDEDMAAANRRAAEYMKWRKERDEETAARQALRDKSQYRLAFADRKPSTACRLSGLISADLGSMPPRAVRRSTKSLAPR